MGEVFGGWRNKGGGREDQKEYHVRATNWNFKIYGRIRKEGWECNKNVTQRGATEEDKLIVSVVPNYLYPRTALYRLASKNSNYKSSQALTQRTCTTESYVARSYRRYFFGVEAKDPGPGGRKPKEAPPAQQCRWKGI